ncbi:ParA family protein [Chondromyces crocatus]|uniref:AAA domain-containing protein n=1 Tax=Chondromyces crocatus TaxID=52 RepID=A0A0K1EJ32_CHOCO|nr:uncharacterized protein CMC5_048330 [Chondromyces crocatus]
MPAPRDGGSPAKQAAATPKPPTLIFAVANQKGGVGKTTTAVNLAASLAAAEHRTLLVDCDPQGNASSGVGVRPRSIELSIYDVLIGRAALSQATLPTEVPLLEVIPATQDLVAAELELVDAPDRANRLRDAIRPHVGDYAFVVLDCPPSLGLLTLNALTAAHRVIVPLQCEYFALEGLTHLMATIDRVRSVFNQELTVEGIVLTMYDGRTSLTHQVADEVKGHFRVFNAIIPRNVRLSEAPSHGKPALLYDVQSKGAQGYLSLAREILESHYGPMKRPRAKPAAKPTAPEAQKSATTSAATPPATNAQEPGAEKPASPEAQKPPAASATKAPVTSAQETSAAKPTSAEGSRPAAARAAKTPVTEAPKAPSTSAAKTPLAEDTKAHSASAAKPPVTEAPKPPATGAAKSEPERRPTPKDTRSRT